MKSLFHSQKISLTSLALTLLLVATSVSALENDKLTVTRIHRISHPAYDMDNTGQSERNPFNIDNSRVFLDEAGIKDKGGNIIYHPAFPGSFPNARNTGRGLIWGCLKSNCVAESAAQATLQELDLDNASGNSSLVDWDNNTFELPNSFDFRGVWSPYSGETNIMYALCEGNSGVCSGHQYKLVAYNVDTGKLTPIISYGSYPKAHIIGFTKDAATGSLGHQHEIIIDIDYSDPTSGSTFRVFTDRDNNFANPTKIREEMIQSCDFDQVWYPYPHTIHGSSAPDGLWSYSSHYGIKNDNSGGKCASSESCYSAYCWQETTEMSSVIDLTHIDSRSSNDYYIAGNSTTYPWVRSSTRSNPLIGDERIYQVFFDRNYAETQPTNKICDGCFTLNLLVSRPSAAIWSHPSGIVNYHNMPSPTISPNAEYIFFHGTNGKYTRADRGYNYSVTGNNWEGRGSYLAELAPVSGAQTCTSFTYSAWSECLPGGSRSRTLTSSYPAGCTGGNPVLVQSCSDYTDTASLSILTADVSPAIDGDLGEYDLADEISFSPLSGGNIVTVKSLWDSEALYLGISVTDTQLNASVTSRDGRVWTEDSIEWFIDTLNDGGGSSTPNSAYMLPDDYHGIINILNTKYDSQGTSSGIPSGSWNGTWQSAVKFNGTANNNADTDGGYTIEVKIPWTSIGYYSMPFNNELIGLSVALNDKDAAGVYSIMTPDITGGFENASNWQTALLSGFTDTIPPAPPVALRIIQ
ncbi:MAG: hypothetical protein HZA16_03840 [Nitrospirae bacterium]|nr:hypothetical protein [Nitrospirota bacterium]